jgi:hypothetical protein
LLPDAGTTGGTVPPPSSSAAPTSIPVAPAAETNVGEDSTPAFAGLSLSRTAATTPTLADSSALPPLLGAHPAPSTTATQYSGTSPAVAAAPASAWPTVGTAPSAPATAAPSAPATAASNAPAAASAIAAPPAAPVATAAAPTVGTVNVATANTATPGAAAPMDRDFIARNQIVERYLSGRLPLKGATDFERFCKDNPEVLDELGLPERVHAGLRLLEASGKPEPWQEKPQASWTQPKFVLTLLATTLLLGGALAVIASGSAAKSQKIAKLQKQSAERPLDPATSTHSIRLVPSREAASNSPAVVIGGGPAELVDFKIDETRSAYKTFRITIDRIDQGRVAVLHNLVKDSNGHLRVSLNSSALGPGNYLLTIEGLSWRGDAEPDSWVTIGIQR